MTAFLLMSAWLLRPLMTYRAEENLIGIQIVTATQRRGSFRTLKAAAPALQIRDTAELSDMTRLELQLPPLSPLCPCACLRFTGIRGSQRSPMRLMQPLAGACSELASASRCSSVCPPHLSISSASCSSPV